MSHLVFSFCSPSIIRWAKMKNFIVGVFVIFTFYLFILCQGASNNLENARHMNRVSRYISRTAQLGRIKPDAFLNEFNDDDDVFDLSKRQQSNSDDYGHLRFGKRYGQFDDYGHMRFGRNSGD